MDGDGGAFGGPLAFLLQRDPFLRPVGSGRHIEGYPDGVVVDKIGSFLVFHVVLHTRTAAAGGLRCLVAPGLRGIKAYGILVNGLVPAGVHRTDDLIIEHALVVVHVFRIVGIEAVQVLGEFGEVVGAAGLVDGGFGVQFASAPAGNVGTHGGNLRVGLPEHLAIAHATHGIAIAALDHRPEVLGEVVVVRVAVATEGAQGAGDHGDMLVGVTRADGIHIPGQRVEEGRTVEVVGSFQQMGLFLGRASHLRQTGQRLSHATHLAGDVHVPHLIAVAWTGTPLVLTAVALDVCAVVQTVPYPETHILGDEQGLGGCWLVVDVGGDIDESGELFVDGVVGGPHPTLVIIGAVHLNQYTVLGGDGIQVTIAVLLAFLLVAVKIGPGALHLLQLLFGGEVAGFPVAPQLLVPHEGALLTLAQFIYHRLDVLAEDRFLVLILATGEGEGHGRHVVAGTMTL